MIEMFDPQYYLQMYRELQAIAPELEAQAAKEAAQEEAKVNEREQKRRERIHRQYDQAIRKKMTERLDTDERREQQRKAQKAFRSRNTPLKDGQNG